MPISSFRLAQLVASGLLVLATFNSSKAQETPLDPNLTDIPLPQVQPADLQPVTQLVQPEIDQDHCLASPGTFYPPVYYPEETLYCPTGVVHRDWFREKTVGFFAGKRQRMLEKDYQWAVQNGQMPVCCPPHSCWGHACECCPGVGCHKGLNCKRCESGCQCNPCNCNSQPACVSHEEHTSAVELPAVGAEVLPVDRVLSEPEVGNFSGIELASHQTAGTEGGQILLVSDQRPAGQGGFAVETAGFHEVSDHCATEGCPTTCLSGHGSGYCEGGGHFCPLHRRHCFHGYYGRGDWEECPEDDCHCPICCLKNCCKYPFCCLCDCLYSDHGPGWRREIHPWGSYHLAYPVNPYHFDQRDGRIYAAQGYGHPVGVPLAPNVEHTYNYGWGVPSSRLSPVSRMPGAPGVAVPPGVAGPGVLPPGFPAPLTGGFALPQ